MKFGEMQYPTCLGALPFGVRTRFLLSSTDQRNWWKNHMNNLNLPTVCKMKKYHWNIARINTVLTLVIFLLFKYNGSAQDQTNAPETNPEIAEIFSNVPPPPPGFATPLDYIKSFKTGVEIEKAYRSGKITQAEAMLAMEIDKVSPNDKSPMDTYAKVVDQNGQPVIGAEVRGFLDFEEMDDDEEHDTTTDSQGQFNFLGLHGKGMVFVPEKAGYEYDRRDAINRPKNYLPDPNNPLIITMWKLRGAEPMRHSNLHAYIPCDGTVTKFNLLTGKDDPSGDLTLTLNRNPVNIVRGKPFDWSVTLEIPNGGFQEITNLYPNEAPEEGYRPQITYNFQASATNWTPLLTTSLYFKSKNGQIYGRMTFKTMADFQPPPTLFDAEIYANPSGSQNLEFDPKKQIR